MIELKEVRKIYETKKGVKTLALDNVSFKLPNRGMIFILGKSGSGKSTLLNILGGLDQYDSGDMIVDSKSTKDFKEIDFDYYRNAYVGFIFQEFNLLEEYNVYDNISLSRKLQKEKVSQTVMDELLAKVGIENLGKRRINELSGGQKGRVAIARALIKNPELILADEPTGNLDVETGKQIFELLKSISKEKLVVVVSHDRESALKYADGIIEITDGKVVSNSIPDLQEPLQDFKSKKSKLPFLSSLKLAWLNLKNHKLKLLFTTLLVSMSLLFLGFSLVLTKFDIEKSHAKTMKRYGNEYVVIQRDFWQTEDSLISMLPFFEIDMDTITKKIDGASSQGVYQLYGNDGKVYLEIDDADLILHDEKIIIPEVMEINPSFLEFHNVIGRMPETDHEILIYKSFANHILEDENRVYNKNDSTDDYEKLFNKEYLLGAEKIKIVGIIEDEEKMLSSDIMFVIPGFLESFPLENNSKLISAYYQLYSKQEDKEINLGESFKMLNEKTSVIDETGIKMIDTLKENEIIISEAYLDELTGGEYLSLKKQYLENHSEEDANIEFLKNYLKENTILEKKLLLVLQDSLRKIDLKTYENLTIVGVSLENDFYLPNSMFEETVGKRYQMVEVIVKENDEAKLEKLFTTFTSFSSDGKEYIANTIYSNYFHYITKETLTIVSNIFIGLSLAFGLFAIILLMNFITTTIYQSKKEIGILRGLGARQIDAFGIFFKEGLMIGIFSFILSIFALYKIVDFANQFISKDWTFEMQLVIVSPEHLLFLLGSVVGIIFLSSLFTVRKITKMKPVDAIANK